MQLSPDHQAHRPYRAYLVCPPMCENSPPGVRITSYADFARGHPTQVTNPDADAIERAMAVQRALSRVGERRYSLTGNNCEHFATWCATGIAVSQQVVEWIRALCRIAPAVVGTMSTVALAQAALAE